MRLLRQPPLYLSPFESSTKNQSVIKHQTLMAKKYGTKKRASKLRRISFLKQLIQLGPVRPVFGVDAAACLLDGDLRRITVRERNDDRGHGTKENRLGVP